VLPILGALILVVVTLIVFLVLYPLATVVVQAFVADGNVSADPFGRTLSDPSLGKVLANTVLVTVIAGAIATVLGAVFAWLNERTDVRMGWASDLMPVIPLLVPPVAGSLGWVFMFSAEAGFVNARLRDLMTNLGHPPAELVGPFSIYTLTGVIAVTAIYLVPYVYLTMSAALRNYDSSLEEASRVSGAGPLRTLMKVTLPSVRHALASSAVLVVMTAVALFSVPAIIGIRARVDVLSVLIFQVLYSRFPPQLGEALVLSIFMLFAVQTGVLVEYLISRGRRHATIGGRAQASVATQLGPWRWVGRIAVVSYVTAATAVPVFGLLIVSLQRFWSARVLWNKLSLYNYHLLFVDDMTARTALLNSVYLGVVSATVAMLTAALLAFFIQHSSGVAGRLVDTITALPASVPHTVVGVGFLVTFATGFLHLSGTMWVLFLAYLVVFLPQAMRSASSALASVGRELWESSLMSGASPMRTFGRILLPLMLTGLVAGWVILFALVIGELSASIFLSGRGNQVVGPLILDLWQNGGTYPELAALALVISALNTAVVLIVLALGRGNVHLRIG
jgi:iron(III) transport system permease protein